MAPKCRKMAPRSFQEPSSPLLVALGPLLRLLRAILGRRGAIWAASWGDLKASWGELRPSGGDLEASWRDLGAILGAQEGAAWDGWRRHSREAGPLLETFCRKFLREIREFEDVQDRDVHNGPTTRRLRWGRRIIEERFARPPTLPSGVRLL